MKGKILITFFVALFLLTMIPFNTVIVKGLSNTYNFTCEGKVAGSEWSETNGSLSITSKVSGSSSTNFAIKSSGQRTGTRCFYINAKSGWWNLSSYTGYLTNFSFWIDSNNAAMDISAIYFYNYTLGVSQPIIHIDLEDNQYNWFDESGVAHNVGGINLLIYSPIYVSILNNIGDVRYGVGATVTNGVARRPSLINQNYKIDRVWIASPLAIDTWFDDFSIVIFSSYTVGGSTGGCIDTTGMDYYSKNIEVMDGYIDISTPYIEFTSHSALSVTPEVFELWVGSSLYEGDDDTSNYFLYINGLSAGNPECIYLLSGETYVMQWDLGSMSSISEEVLVFEIAHTITFDGLNYWNIAKVTALSPPSPTQITYRNSGTNGVLDGSPYYYGSCWKLFYSAFGTPEEEENNDFNVGISLIGFNTHSIYNTPYSYIYDTVYFEVFSNRTDNYYHINISKGSSTIGNEQGYPKDIYSYHIIHGFTPTSQGNYTVSLCKDSTNAIVDHKHFNITTKTVDYAIWTFPNPSNTGVNHGVGVYISDNTTFISYYVSGVVDNDNVNNYTLSDRQIKVGTLDLNNYWSTSLVTFAIGGWEYWRLWGTNDNNSFIPLTSIYLHYVNTLTTNNYIRTSLTNGEGYTGESFNVYGQHGYILSQLQIYLDNKQIKDVSKNVSFLIPYSFSSIGTHIFSLRILNNGTWEIVDSVVVSIVIRQSGQDEFSGLLPEPYSYIMGAFITIALMILPSIGLSKIGMSENESLKYVPIFSGTVGFILCCLIGFFPWYSMFALMFVLILIIAILYQSKKNQ